MSDDLGWDEFVRVDMRVGRIVDVEDFPEARRYAKSIGHEVPLSEAIGKVAAEEVEVYPPGIPVILEGFRVSADAVQYLVEARDSGGSIVGRDTSLKTLRVL